MVAVFKGFILKTLPSKKPRIWSGFLLPAWFFFVCVCRNSAASTTWKIPYLQELFIHHPAFLIMLLLALLRRLSQKKICCWFPRCLLLYWFLCCGLWFLLLFPGSQGCLTAGSRALLQRPWNASTWHWLFKSLSLCFLKTYNRFWFQLPTRSVFLQKKKKKKEEEKKWFPSIEITLLEKLLKLKCALKCIYYLFYKWRQRSSGVVRWGDFHQTQNHSESPSDVIKFHHHSMWSYLSEVWEVSNF